MFPHGASPRRRPANNPRPYHAPSPVDPHFFQRGGVNGYDVPVHDSLATHDWKPHPPAPPPPRHMENWRKRKHEDHDPSIAKRLRDDSSSSVPSSRHPQSRHSRLSFSPDHAVAGFSRSSPDFGHLPPRPHSHLHPHVHPVPHNSANLNFFANDRLSAQVMTLFEMCQQQSSDLCRKEKWRSWLQRDRRIAEMGRLYMTGSTMSGFATRSSDADLCYVLHESEKRDPIAVLSTLQRIMRSMMYVERLCLIRAKVPILRFQEKGSNLVFDLNVNNTVGIRNTFLLKSYAYVEPRIRPLVVVVKKWARHHQINDASQGTLSSYALALMVLHYLQSRSQRTSASFATDGLSRVF
ncbi:poly(A) RNA polymerase GLD2 isoform X2 [Syngnathoides biaculeatus]|uniref:poly(A) RNA polymerase GLD2 isoform X2 n=1 Tax=Syngnathoides biaculeatus TaxID=300417 RepID=UPI002ADE53C0|nr:poly(A) RNA polymerase GLD2 isoform X2 [Syngnathoides biaculeatus]